MYPTLDSNSLWFLLRYFTAGCEHLIGSCGRVAMEGVPHKCAPVYIPVPDDEEGYKTLMEAFKSQVPAHCTHSRIVLDAFLLILTVSFNNCCQI